MVADLAGYCERPRPSEVVGEHAKALAEIIGRSEHAIGGSRPALVARCRPNRRSGPEHRGFVGASLRS